MQLGLQGKVLLLEQQLEAGAGAERCELRACLHHARTTTQEWMHTTVPGGRSPGMLGTGRNRASLTCRDTSGVQAAQGTWKTSVHWNTWETTDHTRRHLSMRCESKQAWQTRGLAYQEPGETEVCLKWLKNKDIEIGSTALIKCSPFNKMLNSCSKGVCAKFA